MKTLRPFRAHRTPKGRLCFRAPQPRSLRRLADNRRTTSSPTPVMTLDAHPSEWRDANTHLKERQGQKDSATPQFSHDREWVEIDRRTLPIVLTILRWALHHLGRSLSSPSMSVSLRVVGVRAFRLITDLIGCHHDRRFECPGKLDLVDTPWEESRPDRRQTDLSPKFVLDFMSASDEDTGGPGGPNRPATPGVRNGTVYAAAAERRTHYKAWAESRAGA